MRVQESYIDIFTAQVAAPRPLWGLFLSQFEKTEFGGIMKPFHSPE